MAKKNASYHPQLSKRAVDYEVVQLALLPDHIDQIVAIKPNVADMLQDVQELIDLGYEVSFTANKFQGGYSVLLKGAYDNTVNFQKCFYSNADNLSMALVVCLFKHFTVANGELWEGSSSQVKNTFS